YEPLLPRDEPILEAGCGLGPKLFYFQNKGYRIVGVDYLVSPLLRVKRTWPRLPLAAADVHHCPFPDAAFGAYLSYGVVEHFPRGPEPALKEARRILKPGGLLVLLVPADNPWTRFVYNENNILHRLRRHRGIRKLFRKPPLPPSEDAASYFKLFGREEMRRILHRVGFSLLLDRPVSHSFNLYLGCECFQRDAEGGTHRWAEGLAAVMRRICPWSSANHLLFVARKADAWPDDYRS
nr:methyltransferase domain-containing protein [Nitrospinaceae bacterium]NIR57350.1 methyltransferase domain-containing protein [Nitrospinaceae bacterium]NIS87802.1 methyltransferase domain-containing protein [Nitrospinaceae bacterium]NIT84672.1 methyltransferase domain-containing protein [Nitrospinaceae bacterium]NIU46851.1 methyltransferase domain-containing protein [Nitrospinaceae bacterium]